LFFVFKIQELLVFFCTRREQELPFFECIIAFFLSAKKVQISAGIDWNVNSHFDLVVHKFVSWSFGLIGVLPKMDDISAISAKKCFHANGNW